MSKAVYLALDFPDWQATKTFIDQHHLHGIPVKVGMELFYREGPYLIENLKENGHAIFLDLKLHDIPTTVRRAMKNLATLEVDIINIHALGGSEMIHQAKEGLDEGKGDYETKLIAVTILTSLDASSVKNELLLPKNIQENVVHFAHLAKENGADGVVCSVHEVEKIKAVCGENFLTITPGIRLQQSEQNDQKRTATPRYAKSTGSDMIVVGRSVTRAGNPLLAYEQVVREWENG